MISFLHGTILLKDLTSVIIDVNGVGYKVQVAQSMQESIGAVGTKAQVFIYTHVRQDYLELYGFLEHADLKLFELLIGVSGIGPRTALGIFNNGSRGEIISAILKGDVTFFSGIPRLGKKNAQKIIIELRSKLGSKEALELDSALTSDGDEVVEALKSFGYTIKEAQLALRSIGPSVSSMEEKVRLALKYLGK